MSRKKYFKQAGEKSRSDTQGTSSLCSICHYSVYICAVRWHLRWSWGGKIKEAVWLQKRPQLDKLSMTPEYFFSLCCDIHIFLSNAICLLDFGGGKLQCAVRNWQRSYLWFFMESDVHPPVARQSSLLHCMMPEVIIISKNLNTGKEMFNCSGWMSRWL